MVKVAQLKQQILKRKTEPQEKQKEHTKPEHSPLGILLRGFQHRVFPLFENIDSYCISSESNRVFTHFWTFQLFFNHAFAFPFGSWRQNSCFIFNSSNLKMADYHHKSISNRPDCVS